jgi:OFA family oxalate/formate antiporter-like MFS transporter
LKKWLVLCAGIIFQTILGGIYAWSSFVPVLIKNHGFSSGQCGLVFGIMIAVFSVSTIPAGYFLNKFGPRLTALSGSILFSSGYILASFAGNSYSLLVTSLGFITGIGVGLGYVCPMSTGMKWFPQNRGLITGVAVAGFGGGAILLNYLVEHFVYTVNLDIEEVFRIIGIYLGLAAIISSLLLSEPYSIKENTKEKKKDSLKKHIFSKDFLILSSGMFAGTFSGLLLIGNLKPVMLDFGMSEFLATSSISIFALGNITGRILWGKLHDRFKSSKTIRLSLTSILLSFVLLSVKLPYLITLFIIFLAGAGFGGCFVVYASSVVERFGIKLFSRVYPICFMFYGLAALTGPSFAGYIRDITGSYQTGIYFSVIIILISLFISIIINPSDKIT